MTATSLDDELTAAVSGKRVLVTGASAGIGHETARRVAAAGGEVLLLARREPELQTLAAELRAAGAKAHVMPCDLSDTTSVDALVAEVIADHGGVDVLINNAGRSLRRPFDEQSFRQLEAVMQLNYHGVLRLTLPLVEDMRQRGHGHIINVLTMGTQIGPAPRFAGYVASKAALLAFTRTAAAESIGDGVLWTSVHMPLVRTDMLGPTRRFDDFPALTVEQAAAMMVDAIVRRPVHISHPWSLMIRAADLVAPRWVEQRWGRSIGQATRHRADRDIAQVA